MKEADMKELTRLLKSGNNRLYRLLLIFLAGVCLVIVVWPTDDGTDGETGGTYAGTDMEDTSKEGEGAAKSYEGESAADYTEYMESRLKSVLSGMAGLSQVSVMITVKDNGERITAKDVSMSTGSSDNASQSSTTESTVMQDGDGMSLPYVTRYVQPDVEGVVVCCKGAENADTVLQITNAVQALFDVPVHKIVILEAN